MQPTLRHRYTSSAERLDLRGATSAEVRDLQALRSRLSDIHLAQHRIGRDRYRSPTTTIINRRAKHTRRRIPINPTLTRVQHKHLTPKRRETARRTDKPAIGRPRPTTKRTHQRTRRPVKPRNHLRRSIRIRGIGSRDPHRAIHRINRQRTKIDRQPRTRPIQHPLNHTRLAVLHHRHRTRIRIHRHHIHTTTHRGINRDRPQRIHRPIHRPQPHKRPGPIKPLHPLPRKLARIRHKHIPRHPNPNPRRTTLKHPSTTKTTHTHMPNRPPRRTTHHQQPQPHRNNQPQHTTQAHRHSTLLAQPRTPQPSHASHGPRGQPIPCAAVNNYTTLFPKARRNHHPV